MTLALGPLKNRAVMTYLDDLICSANDSPYMIFKALQRAKLTLKLLKCISGAIDVEYLWMKNRSYTLVSATEMCDRNETISRTNFVF